MSSVIESVYGSWQSPITSEFINSAPNCQDIKELAVDYTDFGKGVVYWVEQRNDGRVSVYSADTTGVSQGVDDLSTMPKPKECTPYPFSARNQVHEYGGGVVCVHAGNVFFTTPDGVYRRDTADCPPVPLVKHNDKYRYADLAFGHNSIYCIREDHSVVGQEPVNSLVRIAPAMTLMKVEKAGSETTYTYPDVSVMVKGANFYSTPRVSRSGTKLCWVQWNHPNMPWDATEVWVADLEMSGEVLANSARKLLGDGHTNFIQPHWSSNDDLYVIADADDWWNIYEVDFVNGTLKRNIYPVSEDMGRPHWVFGSPNRVYSFERAPQSARVAIACKQKVVILSLNDPENAIEIDTGYVEHHSLSFVRDNAVYCIGMAPNKPTAVLRIDLNTGTTRAVREQTASALCAQFDISVPETITFPTGGDTQPTASGYFYAPKNSKYTAPAGTLPPVILKAHGGPTGAASRELNWELQYFTSRGFAIMDVNYRGSTGFGRAFRSCLYGHCGDWDVDDVCSAAKYLVDKGLVDGGKLCIKGGSAGGYIVLRASLRPNMFAAGVSLYGISDVEALMKETHKFESHYDCFAQGITDEDARLTKFRELSPINYLNDICMPTAFFQGTADMVVPLNQAEAMYKAVKEKGLKTTMVIFEGEGHGFRLPVNKSLCLDGSYFYLCTVLDIKPAIDPLLVEKMVIDNITTPPHY